eukprot:scaffold68292_cov37-Tisochrysis_lutea.AAC.2
MPPSEFPADTETPKKATQTAIPPMSKFLVSSVRSLTTSEATARGIERESPTTTTRGEVRMVARASSKFAATVPRSALPSTTPRALGEGRENCSTPARWSTPSMNGLRSRTVRPISPKRKGRGAAFSDGTSRRSCTVYAP